MKQYDPAGHPRHMYYLRDGSPCDLFTWARQLVDRANHWGVVDLVDDVKVSTYFDGLATPTCLPSETWDDAGLPPLVYSTIVVGPGFNDCVHYATEQQARRGHLAAVERVRGELAEV